MLHSNIIKSCNNKGNAIFRGSFDQYCLLVNFPRFQVLEIFEDSHLNKTAYNWSTGFNGKILVSLQALNTLEIHGR